MDHTGSDQGTQLTELRDRILADLRSAGAVAVGVCGVEPLDDARRAIESRRAAGLHATMQFTYRNPSRSTDPRSAFPSARSAIAVAWPYRSSADPQPAPPSGAIARYAAQDAYLALRAGLDRARRHLVRAGHRGVAVADSNALVDRAMAHRAGVGWFGKNTNILVPGVGSWVVLGTVLTDASLPHTVREGEVVDDRCGSCRRCIDACPTGAFVEPGVMDARRCLSWLLQATGSFPRALRPALGVRLYGCDDCQEVCPPNRRAPDTTGAGGPGGWIGLAWVLDASDAEILQRLGELYIPERDPRWVRRNALVALGNTGRGADATVVALVRRYLRSDDSVLVEHAAWAALRLGRADLLDAPDVADSATVREERAREPVAVAASSRPVAGGTPVALAQPDRSGETGR